MRKEIDVTISAPNRDNGKTYHITEMPAAQAEEWGLRAMLALTNSGVQIPEDVRELGFEGIAVLGLRALGGIKWSDAQPLLKEMMTCVKANPDPKKIPPFYRPLVETDIEEPSTYVRLRGEILALHMGFSLAEAMSSLQASASAAKAQGRDTPTSLASSAS